MPAPRFHPLVRLVICASGILLSGLVMGLMLWLGSWLATAWSGHPVTIELKEAGQAWALPLTCLLYPSLLVWIWYCRTALDRRTFSSLGFRRWEWVANGLRGGAVGFLSIALLWAALLAVGAISINFPSPEAFDAGWLRSGGLLLVYLVMFGMVGLFEETLFRGYTLQNLASWLGWRGALWAQAILFSLIHLGNVGPAIFVLWRDPHGVHPAEQLAFLCALCALPSIALIAVFFSLAWRKTGSLWFPIGFHVAWNFALGCLFSLPVSGFVTFRLLDVTSVGPPWLSGGTFGAEGSLLLIPLICALIYSLLQLPDHPQALLDLGLLPQHHSTVTPAEETDRSPRYSTTFRSNDSFSEETLRDLRQLQEERRAEERERKDLERAATRLATASVFERAMDPQPPLGTGLDSTSAPRTSANSDGDQTTREGIASRVKHSPGWSERATDLVSPPRPSEPSEPTSAPQILNEELSVPTPAAEGPVTTPSAPRVPKPGPRW